MGAGASSTGKGNSAVEETIGTDEGAAQGYSGSVESTDGFVSADHNGQHPSAASHSMPNDAQIEEEDADVELAVSPLELIVACRKGDVSVVAEFLKDSSRVARSKGQAETSNDGSGDSALHLASRGGFHEIVEALLFVGSFRADTRNTRGETPLFLACQHNNVSAAIALLKASADPNMRANDGVPPFLAAAFGLGGEKMLELLENAKAHVGAQDAQGIGALHFAASCGSVQQLKWLISHGASADHQTRHGLTPLMCAIKQGRVESVQLLVEAGTNLTLTDEAGFTALTHAVSLGQVDVTCKLLNQSAPVNIVDAAGRSPLFHAVLSAQACNVRAIIAHGARVDTLDEEGRSPLFQACLMGGCDIVESLLQAKADPNLDGRCTTVRPIPALLSDSETKATRGSKEERLIADASRVCIAEARTCLQVSAALGHNEVVARLLDRRADLDAAPGVLGWTALHICAAVGNDEVAALLLDYGAEATFEDEEGNTPEMLATRAGNESVTTALSKVDDSAGSKEKVSSAVLAEGEAAVLAERAPEKRPPKQRGLGPLPPLCKQSLEPPREETVPLADFREEWVERCRDESSLLDRVVGPMVHDALNCKSWRTRWEALTHLASNFSALDGSPMELVQSIGMLVIASATEKVPKVFLASVAVLEELFADSRAHLVSREDFSAILCGRSFEGEDGPGGSAVSALLDQTESVVGSSSATLSQQAAANAFCSCVSHGRVLVDDAALLLMVRICRRLRADGSGGKKERKEAALCPKMLVSNLKLLCRLLSAFSLQQAGIFRRALLLPLLLRGVASVHSRVRSVASDALVQLLALSGGIEEGIWELLPEKGLKAVQRAAASRKGLVLQSASPNEEDTLPKNVIVSEDARAASFLCASELTPQVWARLIQSNKVSCGREERPSDMQDASARDAAEQASLQGDVNSKCSDVAPVVTQQEPEPTGFASKDWKERVQSIGALSKEITSNRRGAEIIEAGEGKELGTRHSLLEQYALCGQTLPTLQTTLSSLLSDGVAAVFASAANLVYLVCGQVPSDVAPAFCEDLLPTLIGRLLDTSRSIRAKAAQTTLQLATLHGSSLSQMIARCVTSARICERSTGPRLQLLAQLVSQGKEMGSLDRWSDDTLKLLVDYVLQAAEHRSGDVRKEASALLGSLADAGDRASQAAERAIAQLQAMAEQKKNQRLGTGNARPLTGSSRLGTAMSRLGTSMNSTGRLGTATSRGGLATRGGTSGGTKARQRRNAKVTTANDGGVYSDDSDGDATVEHFATAADRAANCAPPSDGAECGVDDGVQFFNVNTACPGADMAPELAEGEAVLAAALPLAEKLDAAASDFVAPLSRQFGDGWTQCFYSREWQCRVAALTHLAASIPSRLENLSTSESAATEAEALLDATMRAVHEGLGDQNVRVYAEACVAASVALPAFCVVVEGRLMVAHLVPLLRQLCARMGDLKEVVRLHTTQTLFLLLRPPIGNIVSPVAVATLILRHLKSQQIASGGDSGSQEPADIASNIGADMPDPVKTGKCVTVGWLCRLRALLDLVKEHSASIIQNPGTADPGEWIRLKDGMTHSDSTVRQESARLYAYVCKRHVKSLCEEDARLQAKESWAASLQKDVPSKVLEQVRRLLKLPPEPSKKSEQCQKPITAQRSLSNLRLSSTPWNVSAGFASWVGCDLAVLNALASPQVGDEQSVLDALRVLKKATVAKPAELNSREGVKTDEAFASICRSIQQALSSSVGSDRQVFLHSVDLCQSALQNVAPLLSGLDINIGLSKTLPTLMERTALSGSGDVKIGVASDRLIKQLAQHPKVGCEATTKMVVSAMALAEQPMRPLMLLGTLLGDYGLRLCAKRDIVVQLLRAVASQLERIAQVTEDDQDSFTLRSQLSALLARCNQFSSETVQLCMAEVEPSQRVLLVDSLRQAPNPRLVALGAAAAEQDAFNAQGGPVAGSAVRALSRSRESRSDLGASPARGLARCPSGGLSSASATEGAVDTCSLRRVPSGSPPLRSSTSSGALQAESPRLRASTSASALQKDSGAGPPRRRREAGATEASLPPRPSPDTTKRASRRQDDDSLDVSRPKVSAGSMLSEASTAASSTRQSQICSVGDSPRFGGDSPNVSRSASSRSLNRSGDATSDYWSPARFGDTTNILLSKGDSCDKYRGGAGVLVPSRSKLKSSESTGALMDARAQATGGGREHRRR
eukprot:TRINITY_DN1440_c2_g1_i1.p1 TRINITY_DN1440_c2_g1~~TRINITY_DN1440_c2_g1_i1.p1  ORF type:complete len:2196 (+),score=321.50 TRINITY_DN1440_c2_g1_i1:150-6737(+)